MNAKYEYKRIERRITPNPCYNDEEMSVNELNDLGNRGWKMCGFSQEASGSGYDLHYFFVRELEGK